VRTYRKRTPTQHDAFLQFVLRENIDFCSTDDVQANFDGRKGNFTTQWTTRQAIVPTATKGVTKCKPKTEMHK